MEVAQEDEKNEESSEAGAMVTFAWRPSSCLADGEVVTLVQLAGVFTKWEPVNMTPPPSSLKSRSLSVSSTSSDCAVSEDKEKKSNLNHLGYWTLQRFLSPGSYEYKYVVTSKNEGKGTGDQNVKWLYDPTKENQPDGMGGDGRNNIVHVEDFHKGKGGSLSLSRTFSHDDGASEISNISDDDSDDDISIIQKEDAAGDGWVILSRIPKPPSSDEEHGKERKQSTDSEKTDKMSQGSSESSIEIISGPDSSQRSTESKCNDTDSSKGRSHSRVSTTTPMRSPGCDIERKFIAPKDYKTRLEEAGFVPARHFRDEVLDDCYFECDPSNCAEKTDSGSLSNEYILLSNDHWLRQRNGDWELRYPLNVDQNTNSSAINNAMPSSTESLKFDKMILYHQTTCPDDILSKLKAIIPSTINDGVSLNDLLSNGILRPFSKLQTRRHCFKYGTKYLEENLWNKILEQNQNSSSCCDVNIVVETTEGGCLIAEIEVIVASKYELPGASIEIDRLANSLGFEKLDLCQLVDRVKNS